MLEITPYKVSIIRKHANFFLTQEELSREDKEKTPTLSASSLQIAQIPLCKGVRLSLHPNQVWKALRSPQLFSVENKSTLQSHSNIFSISKVGLQTQGYWEILRGGLKSTSHHFFLGHHRVEPRALLRVLQGRRRHVGRGGRGQGTWPSQL